MRYKEIDNCLSKLDKDIKIQEYLYNRDRKANLQILIENEKIRVQNLEKKIKESRKKYKEVQKKLKEIKSGNLAHLKEQSDTVAQEAQSIEKEYVEIKSVMNRKDD